MRANIFRPIHVALAGAALIAAPALAREPLPVEPGEAWPHPHVEIGMPASLGGITRSNAISFAEDYLDVAAVYDTPDGGEALSLYIFRNTNADVPVWFEQAQEAIESRDIYASPELASGPDIFVLPDAPSVSGLKAAYESPGSSEGRARFKSTGVALFSIDGWYVKLRASSTSRSPEALSAWMDAALVEMTFAPTVAASAAAPIADCGSQLVFKKEAKDAPKDGAANLIGGLMGMIAGMPDDESEDDDLAATAGPVPVIWCRDSNLGANQNVYRANESVDSYLIAFGDNGNSVLVGPDGAVALLGGDKERYSITLKMAGQDISYVAQNRLPSPKRVMKIVNEDRRTVSVPTWGDNKTIELSSTQF